MLGALAAMIKKPRQCGRELPSFFAATQGIYSILIYYVK